MPLFRAWKRAPMVWQLTVLCSCLLMIVAGLIIALVANRHAAAASQQARATAICLDSILGSRSDVTEADAKAHIVFAQALNDVLTAPPARQRDEYVHEFLPALNDYVHVLVTDQHYRDVHPLGRC